MKMKRGVAFVLGVGMIALLFYGYCEFYGNPITKIMAKNSINNYLKNHFTELNYEKSSVVYNFKDRTYYVNIDVEKSEDMDFTISYLKGEIKNDYQFRVIEKNNTESRLQVYLNQKTWDGIGGYLYGDNLNFLFLTYNQDAWNQNKPELDTPIEQMLKDYPLELTIYVHDLSKYNAKEKEELKEQTRIEYEKYGISLSSIEMKS